MGSFGSQDYVTIIIEKIYIDIGCLTFSHLEINMLFIYYKKRRYLLARLHNDVISWCQRDDKMRRYRYLNKKQISKPTTQYWSRHCRLGIS